MRKRWVFALQPLLERRKAIEAEKRYRVARCAGDRDDALANANRVWLELRASARWLRERADAGGAVEPRAVEAHLRWLRRALADWRTVAEARESAFQRERTELAYAARSRRLLERFAERQRRRVDAENARYEELELDEANALRLNRSDRSHSRDAQAP